MTGEELYLLLQRHDPGFFWARWSLLTPTLRHAMDSAAEEIKEQQMEAVYAAVAGEDI